MKFSFLILTLILTTNILMAQVSGCTDPQANNYNSLATINDGSCTYNTTTYSLTNMQNLPAQLEEISGMVFYKGKIYAHQDSSGTTAIYEIDLANGNITKTINLLGVTNIDWEDMTQDDTYFYIADVGNNNSGNRTDLKIYKFAKCLITSDTIINIQNSDIEIIEFSYEDQTDFTPKANNSTSFDCEAVAYNRGKLHLFTKNWVGTSTSHYTLPITPGTYSAEKTEEYNTGAFKITAADFGAYDFLMLIGYETTGTFNSALFLNFGFNSTDDMYLNSGSVRRLDLGSVLDNGQLEGICFENAISGYASNEVLNPNLVNQSIYKFNISNFIKDFYSNEANNINLTSPEVEGVIRYNPINNKIEGFDGVQWVQFH